MLLLALALARAAGDGDGVFVCCSAASIDAGDCTAVAPNDPVVCAALGELYNNDWATNANPALPGWVRSGAIFDYSTLDDYYDTYDTALSQFIDPHYPGPNPNPWLFYYCTVTQGGTFVAGKGCMISGVVNDVPLPSGWMGAALGFATDYCTFSGVRCDEDGNVIQLCGASQLRQPTRCDSPISRARRSQAHG